MSKKKVLKNIIITMLIIAMAMISTLSGYQENVMAAVKKCEITETPSGSAITTQTPSGSAVTAEKEILKLNYTKFIIRSSNGKYAKVENEKVVEGDFGISYFAILDFNEDPMHGYYVNRISDGEQYTIEPLETTKNSYQTQFGRYDEKNDWAFRVESDKPVKVSINSDGTGKTETMNGEKVQQKIVCGDIAVETAKYATSVSGQSIGFNISKKEQSRVVSSAEETIVDIGFQGVLGNADFDNIKLTSEPIVIAKAENAYVISDLAGNVLASKEMACNVYFVSDVATNTVAVTMQLGKNSMIPVPESIMKEGYELEGWYTTPAYEEGTKWEFSKDIVAKEIYLYAKWIKKETTKTITKPAKVKGVTVKNNSKKAVKISWKKVSKATGYEILYSTNKKFKNAAVMKVTAFANSKTIKNLKKGKTYYFKVRAYKKSGKDKITGAYNTVKKVKIKK